MSFNFLYCLRLECSAVLQLPSLPSNAHCVIKDTCTSVDCCIEVEAVKRSFLLQLKLDSCNYSLTVGIEKLQYKTSLISYQFGKFHEINCYQANRNTLATEIAALSCG